MLIEVHIEEGTLRGGEHCIALGVEDVFIWNPTEEPLFERNSSTLPAQSNPHFQFQRTA